MPGVYMEKQVAVCLSAAPLGQPLPLLRAPLPSPCIRQTQVCGSVCPVAVCHRAGLGRAELMEPLLCPGGWRRGVSGWCPLGILSRRDGLRGEHQLKLPGLAVGDSGMV